MLIIAVLRIFVVKEGLIYVDVFATKSFYFKQGSSRFYSIDGFLNNPVSKVTKSLRKECYKINKV